MSKIWLVWFVYWILAIAAMFWILGKIEKPDQLPQNNLYDKIVIQGNSFAAVASVYYPEERIMAVLYEIARCESQSGKFRCNLNGCQYGRGHWQLTQIAIEDCKKNLNKKINPFEYKDNEECARWLYKTYGTKPWGTRYTDWGSWSCWAPKVGMIEE